MVSLKFITHISYVINIRNDELIKAFGERVRALRIEKGYTMEYLAGLAGVDYRQISNIELGKVNTTISSIQVLAKALNVTMPELINLEQPKP